MKLLSKKTPLHGATRSDIQGLRALAVSLVVVFHIWPEYLAGGFIGVDVFFVVSGYLISKHLVNEVRKTGTVCLSQFWIKRIRRLLPASLLVLLVLTLASYLVLPEHLLNQTLSEVVASTLYIQNWLLIDSSVNYLAIENEASVVQHFWSLSVEEQFYIAWPLMIVLAVSLPNHCSFLRRPNSGLKNVQHLVVAVFCLSLIYSVYETYHQAELAYFSTFTRAWEFALGALLVFGADSKVARTLSRKYRAGLSWCGFAMIIISAYCFSENTLFPGYIALTPTIGAVMIIVARTDGISVSFGSLSRFPAVKILGDMSYSTYLWHWPLTVFTPILIGRKIDDWSTGTVIVVVTLICSYFCKKWVEDPFRKAKIAPEASRIVVVSALSGMASVLLLCVVICYLNSTHEHGTEPTDSPFSSREEIQASLAQTMSLSAWPKINQQPGKHAQVAEWVIDACDSPDIHTPADLKRCIYGNTTSDKLLVVIGDSWATHLLPAIREVFSSEWRIQVLTLSQCPIADVPVHQWGKKLEFKECVQHRHAVLEWLEAQQPSLIIVSDSPISTANRLMDTEQLPAKTISEGLAKTYNRIGALNLPVLHIESPPRINCYFEKTDGPHQCKLESSSTVERNLSEIKMDIARSMNFNIIDLTFWVCTKDLICPNQINHHLVKADSGHFTNEFSRNLGVALEIEINRLGISF